MNIYDLNIDETFLNGQNILITGGTGSFGNKMVETLLKGRLMRHWALQSIS